MVKLDYDEQSYYIIDENKQCCNKIRLTIEDLLELNSATTKAVENLLNF